MNISSSVDLALGNTALNLIALPTYYFTRTLHQITKLLLNFFSFSTLSDEMILFFLFFQCICVWFMYVYIYVYE